MTITDVRVRKISKEGKMKAVVSVTIDDEFVVHDIKVIEGDKGLFIAMPSRRSSDGEYRDVAHPINTSTRERLQAVILEAYEKQRKLCKEEKQLLHVLLLFPEKFWKVSNHYSNSHKAWVSGRDIEKLNRLIAAEPAREHFLENLFSFL